MRYDVQNAAAGFKSLCVYSFFEGASCNCHTRGYVPNDRGIAQLSTPDANKLQLEYIYVVVLAIYYATDYSESTTES